MDYAYEFIIKNKGIDTEKDYPYRARDGTCNKNKVNLLIPSLRVFFLPSYPLVARFIIVGAYIMIILIFAVSIILLYPYRS